MPSGTFYSMGDNMEKLRRQMDFLIEIDKLKGVIRQSLISDGTRHENDAEHSWHMCMYAVVLEEYAPEGTDMLRCLKLMLIHDLVEVYAGDTYLYDEVGYQDKEQREQRAADKLFGILGAQGEEIKSLWYEFEACETPSAIFANQLDRLQPVMLNYLTKGEMWLEHGVHIAQVLKRGKRLVEGNVKLSKFYQDILKESVEKGYLLP